MDKTLFPYGWEKDLADFYNRTTADLIRKNSWSYDNNKTLNVDVVRDVTNVSFCTSAFARPSGIADPDINSPARLGLLGFSPIWYAFENDGEPARSLYAAR